VTVKIEPRHVQVLYRGPLESCNYGCRYCPFAKRRESAAAVRVDRIALNRFVEWATSMGSLDSLNTMDILFTPWGEALHRARYQKALATLVQLHHVETVGVQTNLSVIPTWAEELTGSIRNKIGLWATWHPSEATMLAFVQRVERTVGLGINVSVGIVATRANLPLIASFAEALEKRGSSLQWINAYKKGFRTPPGYYQAHEIQTLSGFDRWFKTDLVGERSIGRPCATGTHTVSIEGNGDVTRCHFTKRLLGNIYTDDLWSILSPSNTLRACPRSECNCFQGYVHLTDTALHRSASPTNLLLRQTN
jgi:MoaA/NifB/PqqE/SkfB family radical SAM enzyme